MHDKSNPHLRRALLVGGADMASTDDESGLPSLREGEYQAFARPANKPLYAIHFVSPAAEVRSFQYLHLDSNSAYQPGRISVLFLGTEPSQVIIEGRNLWRLYDYLHQHRVAWIMVAARDIGESDQPIVTGFVITPVRQQA